MPPTFPFKSLVVHYQSSNHPKPGLVNVFGGESPDSLQIANKLFLLAQGSSEQHSEVFKSFVFIIHYCIIIIITVNTYNNYIINANSLFTHTCHMGWTCGTYGWGEGMYRVLVGKPERKRPLGRPRCRWVDNIRMDLWGRGCIGSWWGNRRERDHWGDLGVDGWIILGWICGGGGV